MSASRQLPAVNSQQGVIRPPSSPTYPDEPSFYLYSRPYGTEKPDWGFSSTPLEIKLKSGELGDFCLENLPKRTKTLVFGVEYQWAPMNYFNMLKSYKWS